MTLRRDLLDLLPGFRVTEIIRRTDDGSDAGRAQRAAVLAAAYHAAGATAPGSAAPDGAAPDGAAPDGTGSAGTGLAGTGPPGAVAICWVRHSAGGPVQFLVAGHGLADDTAGLSSARLALPAGATAQPLEPGTLAKLAERFSSWHAVDLVSDGLAGGALGGDELVSDELVSAGLVSHGLAGHGLAGSGAGTGPSVDECLLPVWPGALCLLVLAEPVPAPDLLRAADDVARREQLATADADRFPDRALAARRLRARHAELRSGAGSGFWQVSMLAGASSPVAAARVASLSCASVDRSGVPYFLRPGAPGTLGDLIEDQHLVSTGLLTRLSCPPRHEIPGVRFTLPVEFDVTQEPQGSREAVALGEIIDRAGLPAGPVFVTKESLNRHTFVTGATGSGKSQTVRTLLEAATRSGVPWLAVEPAKAEYQAMAARLGPDQVIRIRVGDPDQIAAGINPLEPAVLADGAAFPLQTHIDLVKALFVATFQAEEPFPQVLTAALNRVYEETGWDLVLGEPVAGRNPGEPGPGYPTLTDLQRTAERVVNEVGYSQRVTDDVLGFIRVRLSSLRLGSTGRFLEGGHQIDFGRLLATNAVLELEDVGDDRDKAFLMGTVLIRLAEHLRLTRPPAGLPELRHLTVLEEAHRLLRRPWPGQAEGAAGHAVQAFAGLLAEVRAYGAGLVIADQIPGRLIDDVIKNTAVKIVHRLPAADDRDAVGATMNATEAQRRYLVTLRPGEGAVFTDGMDFPVLARMPDRTARETGGTPSGPASVVRPRSLTCGADCSGRACTLREMRTAQRTLDEYPVLRLWTELSVLAHLTGWPMPVPKTPLISLLQLMPSRLRDCALSHGVDEAVTSRTGVITSRVSPLGLAAHVATALRARSDRGAWLCQREEPRWLAPAYKWTLVLDALKTADRRSPGSEPHQRTAEWERTYGQAIPGETCARQVGVVQRWCDVAQRDAWEVRTVAFGIDLPSAVERAVGALAEDDDFEERLTGLLEHFIDCRWPRLYLTADLG